MIPENGNRSNDIKYNPLNDDPIMYEHCTIVVCELDAYLDTGIGGMYSLLSDLPLNATGRGKTCSLLRIPNAPCPERTTVCRYSSEE